MKWFQGRRRQKLFNEAFIKTAHQQFADGKITYEELQQCLKAAGNPSVMKKARKKLTDGEMLCGIRDWDWEAILKWFKDYFIPAMKIILPMLLLLDTKKS